MKYLIFCQKNGTNNEIIKNAKDFLPIRPSLLKDINNLLVMKNNKYIAEFIIGNNVIFDSETLKTKLDLTLIDDSYFCGKNNSFVFSSLLTIKKKQDLIRSLA